MQTCLPARLLERTQQALASSIGGGFPHARRRVEHLFRDVLARHQDVCLLREAALFFLALCRDEARLDQASIGGRLRREAGLDAMVIRENEAVRRNERRRAIGEPQRREAHMIQPCL